MSQNDITDDRPIGWGVLATGKIAATFARDLLLVPDAELVAAGSRRAESAEAFVAEHSGEGRRATAHASYDELVADPAVDVVYIATPHSFHLENARLAFEAGKHVLCEKPLTLNAADAAEMVRLARRHDRFLMEAMWTACHPVIRHLRSELASGRFGTPRHLHAELGFRVDADPSDRMFDRHLGASALLDMGVYPLALAGLLLGDAEELRATATLSDSGIDLDVAMTGRYAGGAHATMTASMTSWSSRRAAIATDLGRVDLADFHHPSEAVFTPYQDGGSNDRVAQGEPVRLEGEEPVIGQGYGNEIAEVGRCLRAGLRESPLVPHAQTLTRMHQLDDVRRQIGVRYSADD